MADATEPRAVDRVRLFLSGDVMTGRGIDQILPHPGSPVLHERYVSDARAYVALAVEQHGLISAPADCGYVWGDALTELERAAPDARIVNLETSITTSDEHWPEKAVHYRMHPENTPCLTAAQIDCCVVANNHVMDWGRRGLRDTLENLRKAGIQYAGAGETLSEAARPALIPLPDSNKLAIYGWGTESSGIPLDWGAAATTSGVNLLESVNERSIETMLAHLSAARRADTLTVVSIHWGGNWGYEIPAAHIELAHKLIDRAGVDIIHGHSSHHVKALEVYHGRLIIYGSGDLITDYEGIRGHEQFRGDLALMYFPELSLKTGSLLRMRMRPTRMRRMQIVYASEDECRWLAEVLNREGARFGTKVTRLPDGSLELQWDA